MDTVGTLSGTNMTKIFGTPSISNDNAGDDGNFRFRIRLLKGDYTLHVRGAYPTLTGRYCLNVSSIPGDGTQRIQIVGDKKTSPIPYGIRPSNVSVALGTEFGTLTTKAPTKELMFNIRNQGGGILTLTGSPRVALSGPNADQFQVTGQPTDGAIDGVLPVGFAIRYQPDSLGRHSAFVRVESDDPGYPSFRFIIRGTAPNTFAAPSGDLPHLASATTETSGWDVSEIASSSALDYGSDIDMFRFVLTQRKLCTFWTSGSTDTFGTLYQLASKQTKLLSADAGGENRNFSLTRVLDPGTYIVEVKGANADIVGDYTLHATQTDVSGYTVVTNAKGIPISDGSTLIDAALATDFGSVDYRKGQVDQTYTITNQGFSDISLTGNPKVSLAGNNSSPHFTIKTQPSATVLKPGAKTTFVIRYIPGFKGTFDSTVVIPTTGSGMTDGGLYVFAIQGRAFGPVAPLAISKKIAANAYGSFYFEATGRWKAWGSQAMGDESGSSYFDSLAAPTLSVASLQSPPVAVGGGGSQIHAARQDGALLSWGNPDLASFGDGKTTSDIPVHQPVPAKKGWGSAQVVQIAGGAYHTLILTNSGGVWTWGDQTQGQLGNGVVKSPASNMAHILTTPVDITKSFTSARIIRLAAGSHHNLALDSDGQLWAWGSNTHGQLGLGDTPRQAKPVKISAASFNGARIIGIACSSHSSFAVSESGVVWAWGSNERGVLGDGTFTSKPSPVMVTDASTGSPHTFQGEKIAQITAGSDQAFVLTTEGSVWTWGERVITEDDMSNIVVMDSSALLGLTEKLTTPLRLDTEAPGSLKIIELAAGGQRVTLDGSLVSLTHFLCLRADGTVWAAGSNERGQIGNGSNNGQPELIMLPTLGIDAVDPTFTLVTLRVDSDGNSSPGWIDQVVAQPDGKIIIGGEFDEVNGVRRSDVVRVFPDGSLDTSFSAQKVAYLNGICVMNDGKLLISSGATAIFGFDGNTPPFLRKLLSNGSLDSSFKFQPPALGAGFEVCAIHACNVQRDGKIVIFGTSRRASDELYGDFVTRINANGSRDTSFATRIYDMLDSVRLQPDEKILLNGNNQDYSSFLSRLTSSGTADPSFNFSGAGSASIYDFAILPDGKIMVGGDPSNSWSGVARLSSAGVLEAALNPVLVSDGTSVSGERMFLQADQSLRIFDSILSRIYHVLPDGSTQDFQEPYSWLPSSILPDSSRYAFDYDSGNLIRCPALPTSGHVTISKNRLEWLRGGAALEISNVTFELSTNNGSTWTLLGNASHISGGWGLSGINLPVSGRIRARGRAYHDNSSSLVETLVDFY
ncbi:hypothetical protein BGE01nite_41600 [Brevifollis gellanilyticus]|uniref:Choice-of-anchor D domain-containing protein n=2 Tax=Brevifollis gellanilyticus TaxID=748831 RepID=A0A512MDQ6_9BACT|nr:hypothetical protein BGE01nite_41600 [Brevifollis gellanilyticus]